MLALLRLRRHLTRLRVTALVVLAFVMYMIFHDKSETEHWYNRPAACSKSKQVEEENIELSARIHKVLDILKVQHFLCYGSLWGALRNQKMIPWDNDIDFCVLNADLQGVEEAFFIKTFRSYEMELSYDHRHGIYQVKFGDARAELVVFALSEDYSFLQRIGWENRLFSEKPAFKFPSRLAAPPLPSIKFCGQDMPIPHEEFEIQKYLYPDDWWKEVKPPNC